MSDQQQANVNLNNQGLPPLPAEEVKVVAVPKVAEAPQKKLNKKKLIIILVVAAIVILIVLLLQLASMNTPVPNVQEGTDSQLSEEDSGVFGVNIKSPFTPEMSEKIWLSVKNNESTSIGYIEQNGNFTKVYQIPQDANLIRLFEDESLVFVSDLNSELFLKPKSSPETSFIKLQDSYFTSYYFEPDEKIFYYTFIDSEGVFKLNQRNLKNQETSILTSSFFDNTTSLIYVDTTAEVIYLEKADQCYYLNLFDNAVEESRCPLIKRNNQNQVFWSNSSKSNEYSILLKGEVYSSDDGELERKVISVGREGQVFSNLYYKQKNLYFLRSNLKSGAGGNWIGVPDAILRLDLQSVTPIVLVNRLPQYAIQDIFIIGNSQFIIGSENDQEQKIYQFQSETQATSYPVSAPVASNNVYWSPLNIGIAELIEVKLLQADYVIYDF